MILYVLLAIVIFVVAIVVLITLRLNKFQLQELLYYQYKYIPETLLGVVKVHRLKDDLSV
ncbi:per os infectivity factor 7 [Alphabaculovirus altersperidaniae]|uniref:Per os infectivity factor 7 n=1 Tax=Spodoptera eridania nucleopolyhedrovirus TaxID=2315721 RepID=A0ABX6TRA4_9ABAC|nr:per os infectivity factor 7 [Spodoptera eridania nucleopolyhedrovirus]QNV47877.1 per os infectivity factor 7 [Spodoptera eridania nucleopolyhedrovirus]